MPMLTPTLRAVSSSALAALLAACAAGGGYPGGGAGTAPPPAPAPAPAQTTPTPPPEPPPPAGPAAQAQAQKLAMGAVDLLEAGHEDQARAELQRALSLDGNNKLANNLMRQITVDPVAALGRESFVYVVKPSDTLSRISGRFLGDIYSFYILARYNDIKVPRQVAGGQQLRIPGKAPPPGALEPREPAPAKTPPAGKTDTKVVIAPPSPASAAPAPPPPPPPPPEPTPGERAMRSAASLERAGNLERAMDEYKRAATLDEPGAAAKVEELRKRLVDKHTLAARTAFVKQDLAASIRAWDHVLQLDPGNETAKLERQKAVQLKQKADKL
jgi:tetratricopeptide (TPR) repeat protein